MRRLLRLLDRDNQTQAVTILWRFRRRESRARLAGSRGVRKRDWARATKHFHKRVHFVNRLVATVDYRIRVVVTAFVYFLSSVSARNAIISYIVSRKALHDQMAPRGMFLRSLPFRQANRLFFGLSTRR